MAIQQRELTLEQFLELPEEKPALEYIHGTVKQKASPKTDHSVLQSALIELINVFCRPSALYAPKLTASTPF